LEQYREFRNGNTEIWYIDIFKITWEKFNEERIYLSTNSATVIDIHLPSVPANRKNLDKTVHHY
jgi:hypothetical protein